MVSTPLKNISQHENLPQIREKNIKMFETTSQYIYLEPKLTPKFCLEIFGKDLYLEGVKTKKIGQIRVSDPALARAQPLANPWCP